MHPEPNTNLILPLKHLIEENIANNQQSHCANPGQSDSKISDFMIASGWFSWVLSWWAPSIFLQASTLVHDSSS
jgi:hypothetical protein